MRWTLLIDEREVVRPGDVSFRCLGQLDEDVIWEMELKMKGVPCQRWKPSESKKEACCKNSWPAVEVRNLDSQQN